MSKKTDDATPHPAEPLQCGIVMPISAIDGCPAEHWSEVKAIIQDAIEHIDSPKFTARLVSDADDVGVIQKRIVQGIYGADVIVCDVSGKNPNVMFELGMRLAFDKPTVIVKDDKTDYTFDTGVIEHITYPRDLRFKQIVEFKQFLAQKVLATYNASIRDPDHSTFLKNFGTFKVAQLTEKEAPADQVILDAIVELQREVVALRRSSGAPVSLPHWLTERSVFSLEEVETTLRRAELLASSGTPDSTAELLELRPFLLRMREAPIVESQVIRIEKLLKRLPAPRSSPLPTKVKFYGGGQSLPPTNQS